MLTRNREGGGGGLAVVPGKVHLRLRHLPSYRKLPSSPRKAVAWCLQFLVVVKVEFTPVPSAPGVSQNQSGENFVSECLRGSVYSSGSAQRVDPISNVDHARYLGTSTFKRNGLIQSTSSPFVRIPSYIGWWDAMFTLPIWRPQITEAWNHVDGTRIRLAMGPTIFPWIKFLAKPENCRFPVLILFDLIRDDPQ